MLNKKLIQNKLDLIFQDLGEVKEYTRTTKNEFLQDKKTQNAVERVMERIVGRAIDINQHLILETVPIKLAAPLEYRDTFIKLGQLNVFPKDFALNISDSAGFRNRLIHEYEMIDEGMVYDAVLDALRDYPKYCDYILQFIEKESHS